MTDETQTEDNLAAGPAAELEIEPPQPLRTSPRPHRQALVPLWVYGLAAALLALVAIGIGTSFALNRSVTKAVPYVLGLDSDVARTRLRNAGFEFAAGDRRFSTAPEGTVLQQTPPPRDLARRGSTVEVVVSAGTEEFRLPDIVGNGIVLGRGQLEERGLEVKVNVEASDQPRDTVLSTNPSAGSIVHTGDIVIVTVAASGSVEAAIVPYRFSNVLFVLDPSKPATGRDVPLDVSRRVRSLLEASGAKVVVTRSLADRDVSVQARAKRARDSSATAVVGIDVSPRGQGGFAVSAPTTLTVQRARATRRLVDALVAALTVQKDAPRKAAFAPDALVSATVAPIGRLSLGSLADREDAASFRDPTWADQVARAVYRGLGESYGSR